MRWRYRILACVCLALISTIAVACGLALLPVDVESITPDEIEVADWAHRNGFSPQFERDEYLWIMDGEKKESFGISQKSFFYLVFTIETLGHHVVIPAGFEIEAGWPAKCLRGGRVESDVRSVRPLEGPPPFPSRDASILRSVIPAGFLMNFAFYFAIWFVILAAPDVRRAIRRSRGQCPKCGYELSRSGGPEAGCPECGHGR